MSAAELASAASVREQDPRDASAVAPRGAAYAALDLGTNNCRLLIARPTPGGFRVIDSFSRIVRLGEGITLTGRLSDEAMNRTLDALDVCRAKMSARGVTRSRLIATAACRMASNGLEFIRRVNLETGIELEVVDRRTEAFLAVSGCASLADQAAESALLFDIGGGSSEIVWLAPRAGRRGPGRSDRAENRVRAWTSLPLGVVTLAESYGGVDVSAAVYEAMVDDVTTALASFVREVAHEPRCPKFHLLGTSGTVTTVAGVHLDLPRYDRRQVDGLLMSARQVRLAVDRLRAMSYRARAAHGCIGVGRADLVLAGCAILEAISRAFPAQTLRVADRGLREGILMELMEADRVWSDDPA